MELENRGRVCGWGSCGLLHYGGYSCRDVHQSDVHLPLRCHSDMCDDTSRHIRQLHIGAIGEIFLCHGGGEDFGLGRFGYALRNFRNITLSVLSGFMLGSLNKVWPWKEVEKLVSDGHEVMIEHNVAPNTEVAEAVVLMLIGFILVYVLEKISAKKA